MCRILLDCTDCPISEPMPFSSCWYSHKFKSAGLCYKVGILLATGWIVWVYGPVPCGESNDLNVARSEIQQRLEVGESYIADRGYRDGQLFGVMPTGEYSTQQLTQGHARAWHKTINGRLKKWKILSTKFRHNLELH